MEWKSWGYQSRQAGTTCLEIVLVSIRMRTVLYCDLTFVGRMMAGKISIGKW